MRKVPFTADRKHRFLEVLAACGSVTMACQAIGCTRATSYNHRAADEHFAGRWAEAEAVAADRLEEEARRRAIEGTLRPAVSGGKVVVDAEGKPVMLREYSDRLLELLLRARKPAAFGSKVTVAGDAENPLVIRLSKTDMAL